MNIFFGELRRKTLTGLLLGLFFYSVSSAESPSLAVTQTADWPEGYSCHTEINSQIFSGFVLLTSPDRLPELSPEVYSAGFSLRLRPEISLLGGSIAVSGLPARAKNPGFSLYYPFYSPVTQSHRPLLSTGSTRDIERLGLEISLDTWNIALSANPREASSQESWIVISRRSSQSAPKQERQSLSFFLGRNQTGGQEEESWFSAKPYLPSADFFMPAMEVLFQRGPLRASCDLFANIGSLRTPQRAIRSDISINGKYASLAGGVYRADRDFSSLKGTMPSVLEQIFVAPALITPRIEGRSFESRIGFLLAREIRRDDSFNQPDLRTFSGGAGFDLTGKQVSIKTKLMHRSGESTLSGTMTIREINSRHLQFQTSLKSVFPEGPGQTWQASETTVSAGLSFLPLANLETGIGGICLYQRNVDENLYTLIFRSALEISGRHQGLKLALTMTVNSDGTRNEASIYMQSTLR